MKDVVSQFGTVIITIVVGVIMILMIIGVIRFNLDTSDDTPTRFGEVLNERTEDMSMEVNSSKAHNIAGTEAAEVDKTTINRYVTYHGKDLVSSNALKAGDSYISVMEILYGDENAENLSTESKETVLAPGKIVVQTEKPRVVITRGDVPENDTFTFNEIGDYVIRYTVVDKNGTERSAYSYINVKR